MSDFLEQLRVQRWDDHRYYHHSLTNQSLHLLSAFSFVCAYVIAFKDPATAALIGWLISMTSRQLGHLVFEPRGYDTVNQRSDEFKEAVKVGYNIKRKIVLMTVWALSPAIFLLAPTMGGLCAPATTVWDWAHHVGNLWLLVGVTGLVFRVVQLGLQQSWDTGFVWAAKILTDPFHDILLYHRAPGQLWARHVAGEEMSTHTGQDPAEFEHYADAREPR